MPVMTAIRTIKKIIINFHTRNNVIYNIQEIAELQRAHFIKCSTDQIKKNTSDESLELIAETVKRRKLFDRDL